MRPSPPRYIAGGAISPDSLVYVERPFEQKMFDKISASEWVLLLGPRQCGKTSALIRLASRLTSAGFVCAFVDLQRYVSFASGYPAFLSWLGEQIALELGSTYTAPPRNGDLAACLEMALSQHPGSCAILLDEVSAMPARFRTHLFSQLRALHNSRPRTDELSVANRAVFAFSGTLRPEQLIDSANSPFNAIDYASSDFDEEAVKRLASLGLGDDSERVAASVFHWVHGQPYLTQRLLAAVQRARASGQSLDAAFGEALESITSGDDPHVESLVELVRADPHLSDLAPKLATSSLPFMGSNATHRYAVVAGMARRNGRYLVLRNPVYEAALGTRDFSTTPAVQRPFGTYELAPMAQPFGAAIPEFDVLIVTAVEVETAAIAEVLATGSTVHGKANTYRDLGSFAGARVALVQCSQQGAGGTGGATLTIRDAIDETRASTVLLVGIAFGLRPIEQRVGDVLCATAVMDYEMLRVGTDEDGKVEVRPRGAMQATSSRLLSRLGNAARDFETTVHLGLMLSGDKLVDNASFRDGLRALAPDAIGGEMEALGALAAAGRVNTDWCVVKAVCDFADGKKAMRKSSRQQTAATRAAQFVRYTLELGGFK